MDRIIEFISNFFGMFFFPVRINYNCTNNNERDQHQNKTQSLHYSLPLEVGDTKMKLWMFFFSPLMKKYYQNDNSKDTQPNGQNQEINFSGRHVYSSLFSKVADTINSIDIKNAIVKTKILNFSTAMNCPITKAAITNLAMSFKVFANSFLCVLSSFIKLILQQIKKFVNKFFQTLVSHRVTGSLLLFCVLCGFFVSSALTQEIDIKTKIKELKHKDSAVRIQAVKDLGKEIIEGKMVEGIKRKEIVDKLIETLKKDKDGSVRRASAEVLVNTRDKSLIPKLIETAKNDMFKDTRKTAILGLGQIQDESAVPTLKDIFLNEKEDLAVRMMAGNALSYFANEEVLKILKQGLDNENPAIRLQSVVGLRNMLTGFMMKERIELLEKMLNDINDRVKQVAKESLEKLQPGKK